ncbi:hypothetical protein RB195_004512 [Necator americanus]|uniref:Reverse transcriptase domain-containing protein n=1 Tax=Necator americanus TaxID=51031 RepID=A0ABR1BK56_NECAM
MTCCIISLLKAGIGFDDSNMMMIAHVRLSLNLGMLKPANVSAISPSSEPGSVKAISDLSPQAISDLSPQAHHPTESTQTVTLRIIRMLSAILVLLQETNHSIRSKAKSRLQEKFGKLLDHRQVLDLGPSFAPSQSVRPVISRKIVGSLQLVHERLRLRAKEEEQDRVQETSRVRVFPPIPFPTLLYNPQEANSVVDTKFRLFAMDLTDDSTYYPSSAHEFGRQYRRLNRIWTETTKSVGLPRTTITRLKCDRPTCPVLYVLIKTHKLSAAEFSSNNPGDFKVRPIISNIGGPTDRISWFLNTILSQLLQYVPAHLSNTKMFIEHLRKARLDGDCVIESFDVTSLYTNVSIDAALQATSELLLEHQGTLNMYGFAIQQIMMLLSECLRCSVFRWSGQYYRQIRGLAMGQRLAPTLAVAFMSKVEKPLLERKPLLYCRYIDDCCIVCPTQAEMDSCFDLLNKQSQYIKFTREKPKDNWLPFLNVQVHLCRGNWKTKWYRKPSCKNILIHYQSAHPWRTKKSVIENMFKTAATVSSEAQGRIVSINMANRIAQSNGYPAKVSHSNRSHATERRCHRVEQATKIPFCLPFISDDMSNAVRASLRQAGLQDSVRVVDIPPVNLKQQLVRNRAYDRLCETPNCIVCPNGRQGDCVVSGVIYLITCQLCGAEYIGETGRSLCAHRRQCHDNTPFKIAVTILARESDVLARKTLEAFDITAKSPIMNQAGASLLVNTSGATLTTGGPLTSRFRGYQGSEEGDDAETLARIKINNNLGSA